MLLHIGSSLLQTFTVAALLCIVHLVDFVHNNFELATTPAPQPKSDEAIVSELKSRQRKIAVVGLVKDRFVLITTSKLADRSNGSGSTSLNAYDYYVYDLPRRAFDGTKFYLTGGKQLGVKWPSMYDALGSYGTGLPMNMAMGIVCDYSSGYVLFAMVGGRSLMACNMESGETKAVSNIDIMGGTVISSTDPMLLYILRNVDSHPQMSRKKRDTTSQSTLISFILKKINGTSVLNAKYTLHTRTLRLCKEPNGTVETVEMFAQVISCDFHLDWKPIQAGFVDGTNVVLFDSEGTIISFSKSVLTVEGTGRAMPVKKTSFSSAFTAEKPPDDGSESGRNGVAGGNTGLVIGVIVVLVIFAIAGAAAYFLCFANSKKTKNKQQDASNNNNTSSKSASGKAKFQTPSGGAKRPWLSRAKSSSAKSRKFGGKSSSRKVSAGGSSKRISGATSSKRLASGKGSRPSGSRKLSKRMSSAKRGGSTRLSKTRTRSGKLSSRKASLSSRAKSSRKK